MSKAESKAAEAFRTISEVADELDLQKHVLRFWEVKFPQIRPMKRGGGRRYYRPADMELLRGIRKLLHSDGYTIKGVQRILREKGVDAVKSIGHGAVPEHASPAGTALAKVRGQAAASTRDPSSPRPSRVVGIALGPELRSRLMSVMSELRDCRMLLTGETLAAKPPREADRSAAR